MATLDFITPVNMLTASTWYGYLYEATSTHIVISDGWNTSIYEGYGFTYGSDYTVTGGWLTAYYAYEGDTFVGSITGGSIYAPTAAAHINHNDYPRLFSQLFSGADNFYASDYADALRGFSGSDQFIGYAGNDTIYGDGGNDRINGGNDSDALNGGKGNDVLNGGEGNDRLVGASGNDTLVGTQGNDFLSGGAGLDILIAGTGKDLVSGGAGADKFDFNTIGEIGISTNCDVVSDFVHRVDRIDLLTIDANVLAGGNQSFVFIGASGFSAAGQLRFAAGMLAGDVNGDGAADFQLALTGVSTLSNIDFVL